MAITDERRTYERVSSENNPPMSTAPGTERMPAEMLERRERDSAKAIIGGSMMEGLAGIGAVILSIIGLFGYQPLYLAAVSCIILGAGLLFEGSATGSRAGSLVHYADSGSAVDVGGGSMFDFVVGAAGLALGILAIIGFAPFALLSAAVIVFGAGLLLSSNSLIRMNTLIWSHAHIHGLTKQPTRDVVSTSAFVQAMCGVAAIILGILAAVGYLPLTMVLVSTLVLGAAALLSGFALSSRMRAVYAH